MIGDIKGCLWVIVILGLGWFVIYAVVNTALDWLWKV